jgi:peptidoglycan/LPS O-acetylase OafA/YrhL
MILNEKYIGVNNSYKLFITNRFLRLFPVYWVVLLCTIIFNCVYPDGGVMALYNEYKDAISFDSLFFLIFTNLFLFFQDVVMYLGLDTTGHLFFTSNFWNTNPMLHEFLFIPQAWTIGIELMFYLIAPFLVQKRTKFIAGLIGCSVLLRVILIFGFGLINDPWSYRFFPTEMVFFLLGVLAYRVYKRLPQLHIKEQYPQFIWIILLGITICFTFVPGNFYVKGYLYLGAFFIALPFIFMLTKRWKFDRYIGELSYPVYISHMLIFSGVKLSINQSINQSING